VPDGPKKYAEFLKTRFGIILAIDLADLAWSWTNWIITVKDVILTWKALEAAEKASNEPKSDKGDAWCDFSIDLRKMKWKTFPAWLNLNATGKNSWTLTLNLGKGWGDPVNFTYADWVIKWSVSKDWASWTVELTAWENDKNYTLAWDINFSMWPDVKIVMWLISSKAKPQPAPKK
jgi:hypothetical protein